MIGVASCASHVTFLLSISTMQQSNTSLADEGGGGGGVFWEFDHADLIDLILQLWNLSLTGKLCLHISTPKPISKKSTNAAYSVT